MLGSMLTHTYLQWPGYERRESVISTVAGDGGPLTRFDLGRKITTMYCCLFWVRFFTPHVSDSAIKCFISSMRPPLFRVC